MTSHPKLHTHRTFGKEQVVLKEKRRHAALLQSPLTDSTVDPSLHVAPSIGVGVPLVGNYLGFRMCSTVTGQW